METIDALINKFTQMMTKKFIRKIRTLLIVMFFLSACSLLSIKSYIFTGALFVFLVVGFVYLTIIKNKKSALTIYNGIGVSLVFSVQLVLLFNVFLYIVQKFYGFFDPILLLIILFIEIMCLISGFFYTRLCVNKGVVRKPTASATASLTFVLPSTFGYFLARYINNKAPLQIQNIFYTILFAFSCAMMMFVIGMAHVAIIYYIKKYNIADREISIVN